MYIYIHREYIIGYNIKLIAVERKQGNEMFSKSY